METPLKERPILFSAPMVRAILAGTKTQTRRVMNDQVEAPSIVQMCGPGLCEIVTELGVKLHGFHCRYGQPGDRLYVRETWAAPHAYDHLPPRLIPQDARIHYAATEDRGGLLWRPSIHMPRWASRITLELTGVRVERLQDISEADSQAEGVEWLDHPPACAANEPPRGWRGYMNHEPLYRDTARESFESLWSSINGAESLAANPWVWVVEFKKLED